MDYTSEMADLLSRHGFRRFTMSRTGVGHLLLAGHLGARAIDIILDTGAAKTVVELGYCRAEGIEVIDTGMPGAPAVGAKSATVSNVFKLADNERLTLDGMPVKTDGLFAIDMTFTNEKLALRGVDPLRAIIGQDALRYHQAVIDYATLALFLKEEPG